MEKIKAAIVGLGRIASLLEEDALREKPCTHAGAITANKSCLLAAGCDIDVKRRDLFAGKWNVPVFNDAREMIASCRPDILVIATHPDSHYRYCKIAADSNIPVVVCEKPLADNIKDARKIARLSKNGKPVIIVNHERRYSLDFIRAKEVLDEKKLGSVISVRAVLYMGKTRKLLDQFWHDGTHLADAVMFLTGGTLKHRRRRGAKLSSGDKTAWLEGMIYPDLIPVLFEIGAGRDHLVFEIEFSCEKGRLRIGNGVFEIFESVPSPYAQNFRSLKDSGEKFDGPTGYFANMIKDAAACAQNPQHSPVSGAINGLRVIEYLGSVKSWR